MKKIVAILLAVVLVLSTSALVFAAGIGGGKGKDELYRTGNIEYVNITEEMEKLTKGYYNVPSGTTVKLLNALSVEDNVVILLEDGATLEGADNLYWSINVLENSALTIYGGGTLKGSIFANNAVVNLSGSTIDCPYDFSYCVDAEYGSVFNMFDGTLCNSYFGVNLQDSSFSMLDGEIKDCEVGVQSYNSEIQLLGGTISHCGIGVYYSSSDLELGGSIKIEDNDDCGIDLWEPERLSISEVIAPTDEMHVGLGLDMFKPECGEETIIDGISGEYAKYFFCDDKECVLYNDNGTLKMVNIIAEKATDYSPTYRLMEDAFEGKTIEYRWYSFDKTEITNDETYISIANQEDERYANVDRNFNDKAKAWIVENPLDYDSYYSNPDDAADYVLHVPDNTFVTAHGVLQGITNQYAIGIKGGDTNVLYSSYENMGENIEVYIEDGGDYNLFSYYYIDEELETNKNDKSYIVYSHICFWSKNDNIVGTSSSLDYENLAPGYYVCEAIVKDGEEVVETFDSAIVWVGEGKPFYDEEDADGYGLSASIFSFPQIVFIALAVIALVVVIVIVIKKKEIKE